MLNQQNRAATTHLPVCFSPVKVIPPIPHLPQPASSSSGTNYDSATNSAGRFSRVLWGNTGEPTGWCPITQGWLQMFEVPLNREVLQIFTELLILRWSQLLLAHKIQTESHLIHSVAHGSTPPPPSQTGCRTTCFCCRIPRDDEVHIQAKVTFGQFDGVKYHDRFHW